MSVESPELLQDEIRVFAPTIFEDDDWATGMEMVERIVNNRIRGFPEGVENTIGRTILKSVWAAKNGWISPGRANLMRYMAGVAVNEVVNCYRDGEKYKGHLELIDESIDYKRRGIRRAAEQELEWNQLMEEIEESISDLPRDQARTMRAYMRYHDELDGTDIARKLGISYPAFKSSLVRTRRKIRREYKELFNRKSPAVGDDLDVSHDVGPEDT